MGKFRIELSDGTEHIIDDIVAITPVEGDNDDINDIKRDSRDRAENYEPPESSIEYDFENGEQHEDTTKK